MNAALAFIESAKPQEEVECALVIQMACTHTAAMAVLGRLGGGHGGDRHVAMMATAAARLVRAYATQVKTLRRLRNGGSQYVRVEHVHVNAGGQAVIGNIQGRRNKESSTHGAQASRNGAPKRVGRASSAAPSSLQDLLSQRLYLLRGFA